MTTTENWILVVTNGHIDQSLSFKGPFKQHAQLFSNLGDRFKLTDVADPSGYWSDAHLGRALARLDFNRDGKNDFVVTHLGERSALLLNETPSDNHWLQVRLVGVQSERDAVGARVRVRAGEREWTDWVISGDGYLCRNEAVVSFGLGNATKVDEIVIDWPSGVQQTLDRSFAGSPDSYRRKRCGSVCIGRPIGCDWALTTCQGADFAPRQNSMTRSSSRGATLDASLGRQSQEMCTITSVSRGATVDVLPR